MVPPTEGRMLVLYFFNASNEAIETLVQLDEAVSRSPAALTLLAISRENPDKLRNLMENIGGMNKPGSAVLIDDKGITTAYGLARRLPAAIIVGPGNTVVSILSPVQGAREIVLASADTFVSMRLPIAALSIYNAMPDDWLSEPEKTVAVGYASVMAGNAPAVRADLERLAGSSSPLSSEAHAALGFLLFREGSGDKALAECSRASGSGFADYVAGMVWAGRGECAKASNLFNKAAKGTFAFEWQKAVAFNMAARIAESKRNESAAQEWYKKGFSVAPLNTAINANLLCHHWQNGNIPAAVAYAEVISSASAGDPIATALVNEFKIENEFVKDARAQKEFEEKLDRESAQRAAHKGRRTASPYKVLVADLVVTDGIPELNCLPLAGAALLKYNLEKESGGTLLAIRRPEMTEAVKRLNITGDMSASPANLQKVARFLSADMLMFGEISPYEGEYLLNLRIGDVSSGEIVAVVSERVAFLDDLPNAIRKSAKALTEKMKSHPAGR